MTSQDGSAPVSDATDLRVDTTAKTAATHTVTVGIDRKRVDKAFERVYRDIAKTASVRGFRRGKVPRAVLEKLYGASIPEEVERMLLSETLAQAIQQSGLEPLLEPAVESGRPSAGEDFEYFLAIEVKPEIELPDLATLEGRKEVVVVGDDEIQKELERLQEQRAPLLEEPEDKAAETGSVVNIDFVGRLDGEPFDGGSGEDVEIELGSGRLVPGFEDQLVGAKAGDDVEVKVTFPDDYPTEDLQGKQAEFAVHVATIRRREAAELDDEFAKDLGDFESLDGLRDQIRGNMTKERERRAKQTLRESLLDSLIEHTEFEVSPGVVDQQLQRQIHSMRHQFENQMPPDVLEQQLARMYEDGRPAAARRVREGFLLGELRRTHELTVEEEEIDARLGELAEAQGMPPADLRKMASEQGWHDSIRAELMDSKAVDFLASKATVEEVAEAEPASPGLSD